MTALAGLPVPQRDRSGSRCEVRPGQPRRQVRQPHRQVRPGQPRRPRVLLSVLAALTIAAITATGCASGSSGGGGGGAPAKVSLTFHVTHGSGPAFRHWTLRCEPAGGTHPAAATTCSALMKLKDPFAPPKQMNCPMILRSDRRIVVTGTWFGEHVHRVIVDGGCDLALFAKLGQIFH